MNGREKVARLLINNTITYEYSAGVEYNAIHGVPKKTEDTKFMALTLSINS